MRTLMPTLMLVLAAFPSYAEGIEARLGAMAHDVGVFGNRKEEGLDANIEFLFPAPAWLGAVGGPRPHVGASVSFAGDTSQVYGGLSWAWRPVAGLFLEGSLGAAAHDGRLSNGGTDRKELGTRLLFRESVSVGVELDGAHSVMVTFDHISNANLGRHNEGMDNLGLRWGYRF
ncbi:acyloxyacyl hydrolase [Magnetospirillum sp. UT-4]|uniref:acyloxyacyl hydrolase n=1 Tax=Magnetospirillum sp. UT-4 TaxID=2681467 RepID=UPI001381B930|nr:acyloxyacyl hydrolase [Magnetospirillum sp. UT-4]CAA7616005.1 Lipid A 3-O-deacylase-related protein [Magnetospirillum sp. UT-4]